MATNSGPPRETGGRRRRAAAPRPVALAATPAADENDAPQQDDRLVAVLQAAAELRARYGDTPLRGALLPGSPWRAIYLEALANTGVLMAAADAIGISRQAALQARAADPTLEEEVHQALDRYRRVLHDEAHRRAVSGWDEPVFGGQFKDQVVGYVRKYDPRLLELLLKRHDPEFRIDKGVQVSGTVQHTHQHTHTLDMGALSPEDQDLVARLLGPGCGEQPPDVTDAEVVGDGTDDATGGDVGGGVP